MCNGGNSFVFDSFLLLVWIESNGFDGEYMHIDNLIVRHISLRTVQEFKKRIYLCRRFRPKEGDDMFNK